MKVDAPAKINLGLHVLRRRPDGYHDIETVMVRIGWCDTLEVEPASELTMSCTDPDLPLGPDNLCMKAAIALKEKYHVEEGARLHLAKRIPAGAGLGGGSSDAAATLRALSRMWDLPATDRDLMDIGASIGADVPFFLGPSPALAEGKGEVLTPVVSPGGSPVRLPFTFVVVKPERSVSTVEAYGWVSPSDDRRVDLSELVRGQDLARWRLELINDFEEFVAVRVPEVGYIRSLLYETGAGFAGMSGSGTAVFGVFEDAGTAERAHSIARAEGYTSWVGRGA